MATARIFRNSPMLFTEQDSADYFSRVPVLSCAGFIGPDDSRRFLVEIDRAADGIEAEAERIERAAAGLLKGER